jgi:hypothetical protein
MMPSLTSSSFPYSLVGEKTSADQWHKRLGHPALRTVKQVIFKFSLPVFSNKPTASRVSCQEAKAHQFHFPASIYVCNRPLEVLMGSFPYCFI